jgi:hypothetical protein
MVWQNTTVGKKFYKIGPVLAEMRVKFTTTVIDIYLIFIFQV